MKQKLRTKIKNSLLLSVEKKNYWLLRIESMPKEALEALEKAIDGYEGEIVKAFDKTMGKNKNLLVNTLDKVADVAGSFKKYIIKNNG